MKLIKILLRVARYFVVLFLLSALFVVGLFIYYGKDLPQPDDFTEKPFIQSTKIYDRTGKVILYDIYGEEKRELVFLDEISENLKMAILASEDSRFYEHSGIDFQGIARAILIDLKLWKREQGASTITQQLIRSSFLSTKKTIARKVQEIILTLELEQKYSKDQIFEWYLNQIPFGQNAYGIESASQTYFGKTAKDLSVPESAVLTAMIAAPSYYSPYGPNKEELLKRKDWVLERMQKNNFISKDELAFAKTEEIQFKNNKQTIKAPHFVFYILRYLKDKYGETFLMEKGLKVYTTLDWDIQQNTEAVIEAKTETSKGYNANNAAAVVLDPKTGEVLALVGSKDYFGTSYPEGCKSELGQCLFDPKYDVATLGKRQPGSSFKPFIYATAFDKGYTPSTILWDAPTEFNTSCNPDCTQTTDQYGLKCYNPRNYDGVYRGKVTLRQSLAQSLNLPSVKLLYLAGIEESLRTAQNLGLTTLTDKDRYGLSLVLGGGEVNLLEMTSAYGVFATEGYRTPPVNILRIEDADGNTIEENKKVAEKVLSTQTARLINDILSDNEARLPAFVRNNPLYFSGYDVAAKTGTTSSYMDVWTVGYTPFVAVGVWAGNNDNSPINKQSGIGLAAPIWRGIIEKIISTRQKECFTEPDPVFSQNPALQGIIPDGENHSILQYINAKNPNGPYPQNPNEDPQYSSWEYGVLHWAPSGEE